MTDRTGLVEVALGAKPADTVLSGGRIVSVGSGEVHPGSVAIKGQRIAAVGDVEYAVGPETRVVDVEGRYLCPGLVEAHLHSYHSYLGIPEFSEALLRNGVTTFTDGFYGQGIVGGIEAVRFFKQAFDAMPLRLQFVVPTQAWLQNRESGLTPAPGVSGAELLEMLEWPGCVGVEETPAPFVLAGTPEIVELYSRALQKRLVIGGHGAGLGPRELQAYTAMGVSTDHEAVSAEEARDRLRAGYGLFMRMASSSLDQLKLVKAVTELGLDSSLVGFCADEASPKKLVEMGTVAHNLRSAVASGVDPVVAVQMATINNARAYGTLHDVGILAAGRYADLLVVDDLEQFSIEQVWTDGELRVADGELAGALPRLTYPPSLRETVRVAEPVRADDLRVPATGESAAVRVIGVEDGGFVTSESVETLAVADGFVEPDLGRDILPLAMIDRFEKGTGHGSGFVSGFSLRAGAIGSTVNAVCENLVVVGASYEDMACAANVLVEAGGGFVVVEDGEVQALVELPVLGLINDEPLASAMPKFGRLFEAIRALGCPMVSPLVAFEFSFVCPGVPGLKLSDEGLIRIHEQRRVDVVLAPSEQREAVA